MDVDVWLSADRPLPRYAVGEEVDQAGRDALLSYLVKLIHPRDEPTGRLAHVICRNWPNRSDRSRTDPVLGGNDHWVNLADGANDVAQVLI